MILVLKNVFLSQNIFVHYLMSFNSIGNVIALRERSHMTSAAEGGGGFKMLTVADKGRRGS